MKSIIKNKIVLLTIILLLLFSTFCMAANTVENSVVSNTVSNTTTEGTNSTEATYKFVTSDVYKFDSDIKINDVIDGNVFAFGNTVSISGEIGGDVFVMGNQVDFSDNAYIHGNIFVLANNVKFGGIAYDIYGCAANIKLEKSSIVARDVKLGADNVTIEGSVKRNAYISTSTLTFPEGAKSLIAGNLNYSSKSEISFDKNAVAGEVLFTADKSEEISLATRIASYINKILSALVYSLVVILLAIWLAPKFTNQAHSILKEKPLPTFGVGLLASIVVIAFSIAFLLLTYGLGAGISFAVIGLFILAFTIATTIFSMAIGKLLANKFNLEKTYQFVLLSLAVVLGINLLSLIPYIGGLISFIANMFGIGIITFNLIKKDNKTQDSEIKVTEEQ